MRKKISIEKFLHWAFNDELCKGQPIGAGPWSAIERFGFLGCRVDTGHHGSSGFGFMDGTPHPDAQAAAYAIAQLPKQSCLPDSISPRELAGVFGNLLDDAACSVLASAKFNAAALVIRCATFRNRPEWDLGVPELKPMIVDDVTGKPVVHGISDNLPDAAGFQDGLVVLRMHPTKRRYDINRAPRILLAWENPAPFHYTEARAEYVVWCAALIALQAAISPRLAEHELTAELPSACPWFEPSSPQSKIRESDAAVSTTALPLRPRRDVARAPLRYELPRTGESRQKLSRVDIG